MSPSSKKKEITSLANEHLRREVQLSPKKRKIPALKLTTLAPPIPTTEVIHDTYPQSSPIEDSSDLVLEGVAVPPTALQAGPSRLYLEVKERVAQHSSAKRRDKVIKINTKTSPKTAIHIDEPSIIDISSSLPPSDHAAPSVSLPSTAMIKSSSANRDIPKNGKSKTKQVKGRGAKPPAMTPLEYASKLRERAALAPQGASKKKPVKKFLEGMSIFYIGGDMQFASEQTRGRMNLVCPSVLFPDTVVDQKCQP